MQNKNFSDDTLKEYVSSEIALIKKERNNEENWKKNLEYSSQLIVRTEDD